MGIMKWYEISCDYCGSGQHFPKSKFFALSEYKRLGGIIKSDGSFYCSKECYENGYFEKK
ncbi:MAG: hypothetical protein B6I28_01305 [Fusobacteriia bacterium 4572_132]|nr:MAG: hypothetical protein B6I28_01305 [Fusobacteriia bacterium 4572_132]